MWWVRLYCCGPWGTLSPSEMTNSHLFICLFTLKCRLRSDRHTKVSPLKNWSPCMSNLRVASISKWSICDELDILLWTMRYSFTIWDDKSPSIHLSIYQYIALSCIAHDTSNDIFSFFFPWVVVPLFLCSFVLFCTVHSNSRFTCTDS
jgi:hypothetical protein